MRALHNLFEKILQRKLKFSRFARVFKADISLFFKKLSLQAIDYIFFSMRIKDQCVLDCIYSALANLKCSCLLIKTFNIPLNFFNYF